MRKQDRIRNVRFGFAPEDTSLGFADLTIDGRERRFVVRRFGWRILPPNTVNAYPEDVRRKIERAIARATYREWAGVLRRLRANGLQGFSQRERSLSTRLRQGGRR